MIRLILSSMVILASIHFVQAQSCRVDFRGEKEAVRQFKSYLPSVFRSCDSVSLTASLNKALNRFHANGYLQADFIIENNNDSSATIQLIGSPYYKWESLEIRELRGVKLKETREANFNYEQLTKLFSKYILNQENTGYPFAHIGLDSVQLQNRKLSAVVNYSKGPFITFDTIQFEGIKSIKRDWLAAYLNIPQGSPFSQKEVEKVKEKLERLAFVEQVAPMHITFQNDEATLFLDLKDRKVNRINGLVGFLPNEQDGTLLITGEFDLALHNLFRSGKKLEVKWQSLKARSQFLGIDYYHPNLFYSDLNLGTSFRLLKEDTLFVTRTADINLAFNPGTSSLTLLGSFKSSGLLSTAQFEGLAELPETLDFNIEYYGLEYAYSDLDDPFYPRRGLDFKIKTAIGSKRIRRNTGIQPSLYDGLDLTTSQYDLAAEAKYFLPLGKNLVIYQKLSGAKLINDRLFFNDLYRIGGLQSIRGFNENFFFTEQYLVSNLEARFYFDSGSFLNAFYDQGYINYDLAQSRLEDYPFGIGLGLNLSTSSGLLTLAYALGKSEEQDLSFALSKFHFGYIAKF